jgi:hypothetical protein
MRGVIAAGSKWSARATELKLAPAAPAGNPCERHVPSSLLARHFCLRACPKAEARSQRPV